MGAVKSKRVPRAVREQQMLDAAVLTFARRGYAAASMDEIAEAAGVSKPLVYLYLNSKEDLFLLSDILSLLVVMRKSETSFADLFPVSFVTRVVQATRDNLLSSRIHVDELKHLMIGYESMEYLAQSIMAVSPT